MTLVEIAPIIGVPRRFRAGHVAIRLNDIHRRAYRRLYGWQFPLPDVPALKDHDFDGRSINMSTLQLAALNRRFRALAEVPDSAPAGAFRDQERSISKRFKQMQFLS